MTTPTHDIMAIAGRVLEQLADNRVVFQKDIEALARAVLGMQWRPIAEAPRDGSWFLGVWHFQGKAVYRLGHWNNYHKSYNQVPGYHTGPFTHWQPLPTPPTSGDERGDT